MSTLGASVIDLEVLAPKGQGDWEELAACLNRPYEWFEVSDNYIHDDEKDEIRQGMTVCESCPVKEQCLSTASEDDLAWTVRGGLWPTAISTASRGRPIVVKPGEGYCPHGHDKLVTGVCGGNRCHACYLIEMDRSTQARRFTRRGEPIPEHLKGAQRAVWEHLSHCDQGHDLGPLEDRLGAFCPSCQAERKRELAKKNSAKRTKWRNARRAEKAAALAAATMEHATIAS